MDIKIIPVGYLETNCYILENDAEALIIDPGDEPLKIDRELNKKLIGIIITHYHEDHIGGLSYFKNKYDVSVYDYNNLEEGANRLGSFLFDVIYNPGHTTDSISIYFKEENKFIFSLLQIVHNTMKTSATSLSIVS